MKLTLIGYGTRGDVQPLVALGWALQQRGHRITLAAPTNMAGFVQKVGLSYAPLPVDVQALFAQDAAQRMLANGRIQAFFRWLATAELDYRVALREALRGACADADAMVCHVLMEDRAAALGAARQVPVVPLYFFPVPPSRRFASPFITTRNLGPFNRYTHKLLLDLLWKSSRDEVAALRRELGLPAPRSSFARQAQARGLLTVLGYSDTLFPRPDDWGPHNVQCGSISIPDGLKAQFGERGVSPALEAWLAAGPPPVYLGFGSMPVLEPQSLLDTARRALRAVGVRGVIGAGWSQLVNPSDPDLYVVDAVDHAALFGRCVAAVHHGGSGTTFASLRAGLPTLVCSVFADQPLWGARCRQLGVGDTLPFAALGTKSLTVGLRTLLREDTRAQTKQLAMRLATERGLENVVDLLEQRLPSARPPE